MGASSGTPAREPSDDQEHEQKEFRLHNIELGVDDARNRLFTLRRELDREKRQRQRR